MDYMSPQLVKWIKRRNAQSKELSISITAPQGRMKLSPKDFMFIRWNWTGNIEYVKIQLFRGWEPVFTIHESVRNDGEASWTVPEARHIVPNIGKLANVGTIHAVWRIKVFSTKGMSVQAYSKRFVIQ